MADPIIPCAEELALLDHLQDCLSPTPQPQIVRAIEWVDPGDGGATYTQVRIGDHPPIRLASWNIRFLTNPEPGKMVEDVRWVRPGPKKGKR